MLQHLKLFAILFYTLQPACLALHINSQFIIPLLSGLLELTSGVSLVSLVPSSQLGINVVLCAFLLGFGGISILLQVWSIVAKSDMSMKPYLYGKLLQGLLASIYTFMIISHVSYFKYLLM